MYLKVEEDRSTVSAYRHLRLLQLLIQSAQRPYLIDEVGGIRPHIPCIYVANSYRRPSLRDLMFRKELRDTVREGGRESDSSQAGTEKRTMFGMPLDIGYT